MPLQAKIVTAMDDLYKALTTYYDTLVKTGYMSMGRVLDLLVLDFLTELVFNPDYPLLITKEKQGIVNKLYRCATNNNCLI